MSLIWTILIGFVVGLLARFILPGNQSMGFILTTVLGVVGSLVATYIGQSMGWYQAGAGAGFLASLLGAIVLLFIYSLISKRA
ncbi:MAG: GlsB/YeaQ/YmgE family stress response membrane protein [Burkholderiaceae bacterium]